ncbi:hypothetical protein O0544_17545 [Edwardsiella anguillarum]|nr:hypothetical protein [Edwardsiella anguillarum]
MRTKIQKAKARKAEEDERDEDAEDDERDEDAEDDERDDDAEDDGDDPDASEDDDAEDDGDDRKESKAAKTARVAERKRCSRIFGSQHAAANPSLAASLAFNTGMSSAAAINILDSTVPASQPAMSRKRSLDQRMQESHQVRLNPDGGQKESGKSALVSKMTSLYNSTRGKNNGSVWSECICARHEERIVCTGSARSWHTPAGN